MKVLERIKLQLDLGQIPIIQGIIGKLKGRFIWWGWEQWYKWRWNVTHIDLGPLSIYHTNHWSWKILVIAVWPMRKLYHYYYIEKQDGL